MNLMFWKKKSATGDGAENTQENPDDNAVSPESSGKESAGLKLPDTETPAKPGLVTRMKSKFTALTTRFKKSPSPKNDTKENLNKDTDHPANDQAEVTAEISENPGLIKRIKSGLATLVLRFKKTPAPKEGDEKDQGKDKQRRTTGEAEGTEETSEKSSLLARVKSGLVAFVLHYKMLLIFTLLFLLLIGIVYAAWDIIFPPLVRKPTAPRVVKNVQTPVPAPSIAPHMIAPFLIEPPQAATPQTEAEILKKMSDEAQALAEALNKESIDAQVRAEAFKKRDDEERALAEETRKKEDEARALAEETRKKEDEARAQAEATRKKEDEARAQAEVIKKKNDEARAKALKKESAQRQSQSSTARQTGPSTKPSTSGEMTVGNKDTKATAMTLKEAIEAMNADSGGYVKKPAK